MEIFIIVILISFVAGLLPILYYHRMKPKWFIPMYFFMSMGGVYLIRILTIPPDTISGNGNIAILLLPIVLFTYTGLLYLVWKEVNQLLKTKNNRFVYLFIGAATLILIVCIIEEIQFTQELITQLGGGPDVPDSRIYRFGWFNQYTNTIYVNAYTFFIGLTTCLTIVGLRNLKKK
ncbi:hypothetical protein [Bacillus sp. PS06]|uniref:hypothetical protein n=1 Tax=Bacillus sp. PS06 TaxID=2764176 RepID=UPI00177FDED7|nr:hypothetical protein [Bacillus sp. PS06]MBD8069462.1 hypothetical protein [Bacillus sp. PS06]